MKQSEIIHNLVRKHNNNPASKEVISLNHYKNQTNRIYTIADIMRINEAENILTAEDVEYLKNIKIGERLLINCGEWIERID